MKSILYILAMCYLIPHELGYVKMESFIRIDIKKLNRVKNYPDPICNGVSSE